MSLMELKLKSKSANENEITLMCTKCFNLIRVPKMAVSVKMEYDTRDHNTTGVSATKGDLLISPRRMIDYLELSHDCQIDVRTNHIKGRLVMIDTNISDSVQLFNRKGYTTDMCCEGHYETTPGEDDYYHRPFISFIVPNEKHQNVYIDAISAALKDIRTEYEGSLKQGEEDAASGHTKSVYCQQSSKYLNIVRAVDRIECSPIDNYAESRVDVIVRYDTCNINALPSDPYETFCSLMYSVAMRVPPIKKET